MLTVNDIIVSQKGSNRDRKKLWRDQYKARPDGGQGLTRTMPIVEYWHVCVLMTEIQTIEGGQKDALFRRANIFKKNSHRRTWERIKRRLYMLPLTVFLQILFYLIFFKFLRSFLICSHSLSVAFKLFRLFHLNYNFTFYCGMVQWLL